MYDVIALGELLVDFTPCGTSGQGLPVYQANPGGAPCNVLSMLAKLGRRTAFIGKVGHDMFGKMLRNTLREAGIDDSGLVSSREVNTTLAFVQIDEQGDRDFSFYRNPGADMKLTSGEVDMALVENTRIFRTTMCGAPPGTLSAARRKKVPWSPLIPISGLPSGPAWNWPGSRCSMAAACAAS